MYWSASGQIQRENITTGLPGLNPLEFPLHAFDIEIDGQDLRNRWDFVEAGEREGKRPETRASVVKLKHQVRPITVAVVTQLDGSPILSRHLEITNTGTLPAALARVSPWSGLIWSWSPQNHWGELPAADPPFALGYFDGLQQGTEGNFKLEPLPTGWRRIESTTGHSGFGNPFFILMNNITGETAIGSLAWSGRRLRTAQRSISRRRAATSRWPMNSPARSWADSRMCTTTRHSLACTSQRTGVCWNTPPGTGYRVTQACFGSAWSRVQNISSVHEDWTPRSGTE